MTDTPPSRDTRRAILLGLRGRCPRCGQARLFARGLTPVAACPACQEDFTAQRADDFPAYLVILILGHLIVPLVVLANGWWNWPTGFQMAFWPLLALVLAVLMIRPAKGAVIGAQWAMRMGDFGRAKAADAA